MRERDVADVDEAEEDGRGHGGLGAVDEAVDLCGGDVQAGEVGDGVGVGAVDHGGADGRDGEVRVLGRDEVEGGFFGKGFAGAVGGAAVGGLGGFVVDGVPVRFRVGVFGPVSFGHVDDGGEGGGDDDAADGGVVLGDGGEDFRGAADGGVEEVSLVVLDGDLEG